MPRPSPTVPIMNTRASGTANQATRTRPTETTAPARVPGTEMLPNVLGEECRGLSSPRSDIKHLATVFWPDSAFWTDPQHQTGEDRWRRITVTELNSSNGSSPCKTVPVANPVASGILSACMIWGIFENT
jgi:hypothetical protein